MANILIVDDNEESRQLIVMLLGYRGHVVREAHDGAEALALIERETPDLLISDILMPRMDGYELIRQLRLDSRYKNLNAIFYTAHFREQEARDLAAACGVRHILFKPCDAGEILATVDAALAGAEAVASQPPPLDFDREHLRLLTNKLTQQSTALQVANTKLAAVTQLNMSLSAERDTQILLQQVGAGARSLIGARHAIVMARDKSPGTGTHWALEGFDVDATTELPAPRIDTGPLRVVMDERRAVRMNNPRGEPAAIGLPDTFPPMRALLCAPLVSPTHVYGWICLADKEGDSSFDDEDERILTIIGAQAGRIYENGSLYGELAEHTRLLERQIAESQRASQELERSERRFRQLTAAIDEAFWICTEDYSKFIYVSPAYEGLWGKSCSALYLDPTDWLRSIHALDREAVTAAVRERVGHDSRPPVEFRIIRPDGEVRWIQANSYPMTPGADGVRRLAGVARDITERRAQQSTIERLNRMYALLSGINSMIVRIRDRNALMEETCRVAVSEGGFQGAWAGFIDPQTLDGRVVGSSGTCGQLSAQLTFSAREDAACRDHPASVAARTGSVVWLCDPARATNSVLPDGTTLQSEYRSVVVIPIHVAGRTVGVISLEAANDTEFDEQTMKLLAELSNDVAFGLEHIDKLEELSFVALHDVLTGLPNERLFFDYLEQVLRNAAGAHENAALILIDIDRFKEINDAHGRPVGDAVLRHVARVLSASMPAGCRFARINSDTFAGSVDNVARGEDVRALMDELNLALASPVELEGQRIRISLSAGIALYPADGTDAPTLFKNAEAALVRAKSAGPEILFYAPDINAKVAQRLALEARLHRALEGHEFLLHYQPKIDATHRHLVGLEALIRWNDPEHGLIAPAKFIPALEECGLIREVGLEVMQMAMDDHAIWRDMGLHAPPIAVNVSALQLQQPNFLEAVRHVIYSHGDNAEVLEFEITESVLMHDLDRNVDVLRQLRNFGIQIAIDDFGTGYSSLRYLAGLPINTVKIDGSFVEQMVRDPNSMTIVSTIITLAHSLKLTVCAEGVETEEQSRFLELLRCDTMQGYYFGRPVPASDIAKRLRRIGGSATRRLSVV